MLQAAGAWMLVAFTLPSLLRAQPQPTTTSSNVSHITVAGDLSGKTVEAVQITGNAQVSSAVIRNLIRTRVGSRFDPATVEEDYQRIFGLKKFANVEAR